MKRSRHPGSAPCFLVALLLLGTGQTIGAAEPPAGDVRFTPPPGEETPEGREAIDRARAALQAGRTVSEVLSDAAYLPVRAWPRFRDLIRDHAPIGDVTLVPASEPGEPLRVRGTVRDAEGKPVKGALIYAYQTSAKGWYSDKAAHISGNSGDTRHARLFAYLKTDAEGRYALRTIRPAGYPGTELPAHIHLHIEPPGDRARAHVTEIQFDDDSRLTLEWRTRSRRDGFLICPVTREGDAQSIVADFTLP